MPKKQPKRRDGSLTKAARLVILLDLDNQRKLDSLTLQQIADIFDQPKLNRSTIMRDLADLHELRPVIAQMRKKF